ncbi:MAG: hypothetical protein NVSMB39_6790 [Candidatus Saccharimonadales bacterium]
MTALQDAIKRAQPRIKGGLLGIPGRDCIVVTKFRRDLKTRPYRMEYSEETRLPDNQEWYGFGIYFAVQAEPRTPYYDEVYLSYPKGELALGRPSRTRNAPLFLFLETEKYFVENQMEAAVIEGIDAIGPQWSINRILTFKTVAFQVLEASRHDELIDLTKS